MEIKNEIKLALEKALKDLGIDASVQVEIPNDLSKGDFTSNISMRLSGKLGSPMESGEMIIGKVRENKIYHKFSKIELMNPGFINFYLSSELVSQGLEAALNGFKGAEQESGLILEFGDLNPFKEPHIGHVRNLVLGESLARLLEFTGHKVIRANYEGDVGMHVAKCIYGIQKSEEFEAIESADLETRAKFLGKAYASGAKAFEDDEVAKSEIVSINNKIYTKDADIIEIWEKGRKWSLDYFEQLYKKLGVKYDKYYFESEIAGNGKEIVESHPDVFPKDDGAHIFRGEDHGLHTRVFINKEGNPTYEAKDLGLAYAKDKDFPDIDKSIIMTANEQVEYFKVLLKALEKIDEKIAAKTSHLSYGFINLKEGKMSSRTGDVVGADWLFEETWDKLSEGFKEVPDGVLDDLSIGAVKWSMLKFSRESSISFSIEESIDLAGNSGPYMQYTYTRIASLLSKRVNTEFEANSVKILDHDLVALGRFICQFDSVIKSAADNLSPNILTEYLFVLSQKFNGFYEKEKIIGSPREKEILMVCLAIKNVLFKGLDLLGISAPEKI